MLASFEAGELLVGWNCTEPAEVSQPVRIGCRVFSMQTVPRIFEARSDLALLPKVYDCIPDMVFACKNGHRCLLAPTNATSTSWPGVRNSFSIPFHHTGFTAQMRKVAESSQVSQPAQHGCREFSMLAVPPVFVVHSDVALLITLCIPGMTCKCRLCCLLASVQFEAPWAGRSM